MTYGSPRSWTFAAGLSKNYSYGCCTFIGREHFFCESANSGPFENQWYLDDPLWDSQGCDRNSTCCDRGGPWFTTTLSQEVSNDIEVRMCSYSDLSVDNLGVDELEIYIY